MTDNSSLLNNTHSLTSDLFYNLKPSTARCRSYQAAIPSSNKSTFAPGDTIVTYVGARRNCFLDCANSYIKFTIRNTDATAANNLTIDGTAASFINSLNVYHGSNLLESVQQYDVLFSYLADFQLDMAKKLGLSAAFGCTPQRTGLSLAGGGTNQMTFCLPILSGVVGVMNDKYLPLSLADDIRLEWALNPTYNSCVTNAAGTLADWSMINFELQLNIVELSDDAMRMVSAVTPFTQPVYMHGSSWRHYSSVVPGSSAGQQSFLVPARFASLKGLVVCPRRSTEMGNTIAGKSSYSVSSRINPNIASYWWRLGSILVPQRPVTLSNSNTTGGYAQGFMEILRSFHSLGNFAITSAVASNTTDGEDPAGFNVAETAETGTTVIQALAALNSYKNAFAIAQELESISNRGDSLLAGVNTMNQQIFFEYTSNVAIGTASYTLDFYANYDHILCLDENGLLSVKF